VYYLNVIGRLAAGVTRDQARARMEAVTASLAAQYPAWFVDQWIGLTPLREALIGDMRAPMLMLLGAVGLVLLLACANVANLVLARSTGRAREMHIRAAIGASRWQLLRGLLAESLLLSTAGTALGVLLAWWSVHALLALLPTTLFRLSSVGINLRVLTAAAIAALTTGVFFGLTPAWRLSRPNLSGLLNQSSAGGTSGARGADCARGSSCPRWRWPLCCWWARRC
jgi:putative ABC transport system permease protein